MKADAIKIIIKNDWNIDITSAQINFWANKGLIHSFNINKKTKRKQYDELSLCEIKNIIALIAANFSIDEIKVIVDFLYNGKCTITKEELEIKKKYFQTMNNIENIFMPIYKNIKEKI